MPATVNVNDLTVVHKTSGGTVQIFPDICKTLPGPAPIPYPNVAFSLDTAQGSTTVTCDGHPVMIKSSNFMLSTGDEAGTALGVASNTIKGKADPKLYSMDVKFDGENVMRLTDLMLQNVGTTSPNTVPGSVVQLPIIVIGPDKAKDPELPKVVKLEWAKSSIVCGDKVKLDVTTSNFDATSLPVDIPRNQKDKDQTVIHDELYVPISGDKGSLEWISVQQKWAKAIDVAGEQQAYDGAKRSNEMKMRTLQDAKETIKPAAARLAPIYEEVVINGVKTGRFQKTAGNYGIRPAYDIEIRSGLLVVTGKIAFDTWNALRPGARPTEADLRAWKREIEEIWDGKWKLHRVDCLRGNTCDCHDHNGCCMYVIQIQCEWGGGHSVVQLNDGANGLEWGKKEWWFSHTWWMQVAGNLGQVRAHEFGHLLGMYDEYPAGACLEINGVRPYASTVDQSIMNRGWLTHERHMADFKDWFDAKASGVIGTTKLIRASW
ncbi:MAG TPA: DUF4150 domain-containing protein [Polyangiaceae bacterium]|nr:DUF4150 domain-containing protein [Polyangiaceae bacterium]